MGLFDRFSNWISDAWNSISTWAKPKPQTTEAPKPVPAEETKAASLEATDKVTKKLKLKQGSAENTIQLIADWKDLGTKGTKIDLSKAKQPVEALTNIAKKEFDENQQNRLADFLDAVLAARKVEGSQNPEFNGRDLINILNEGLKNPGITDKQLEAIAEGDFTFEAYQALVKQGEAVA